MKHCRPIRLFCPNHRNCPIYTYLCIFGNLENCTSCVQYLKPCIRNKFFIHLPIVSLRKTLLGAQRNQAVKSWTRIILLITNLATSWRHLHCLQICPPGGDTFISCKFSHQSFKTLKNIKFLEIGFRCSIVLNTGYEVGIQLKISMQSKMELGYNSNSNLEYTWSVRDRHADP